MEKNSNKSNIILNVKDKNPKRNKNKKHYYKFLI